MKTCQHSMSASAIDAALRNCHRHHTPLSHAIFLAITLELPLRHYWLFIFFSLMPPYHYRAMRHTRVPLSVFCFSEWESHALSYIQARCWCQPFFILLPHYAAFLFLLRYWIILAAIFEYVITFSFSLLSLSLYWHFHYWFYFRGFSFVHIYIY